MIVFLRFSLIKGKAFLHPPKCEAFGGKLRANQGARGLFVSYEFLKSNCATLVI
jgi:hypothetical protein